MEHGRIELYTDVKSVTKENIADILRSVIPLHEKNATQIKRLLDFEEGEQPILRKKKYRPDIDCVCVDNIANEISEFKQSYNWGSPITLVMREQTNDQNGQIADAVSFLNRCFQSQDYNAKQQKLARFVEITAVGYTYIDINTKYEEGESPFTIDVLHPVCTFVVKSSRYLDRRIMLSVTYFCDATGAKEFTCFTDTERYELNSSYEHKERSGEKNPLGINPITEWIRSYDRMGCFERQISEMNNLNLLISDFTNDVDQNTQAVWHGNDIDFPTVVVKNEDGSTTEQQKKPKSNDWIITQTTQDGKTPFVKPLAVEYDYQGMLNNIMARRNLILQKCNVPSRNNNSGGSTGIAMSDATGWTQADVEATRQDQIKESCKLNEVRIALRAVQKCAGFPQDHPLRKLHHSDVKTSIKRQRTFEMTTKINAYATGVSHGIYYEDMLKAISLFDDPQQVAENSRESTKAYLESLFNGKNQPEGGADEKAPNADRLEQDKSDQETQSPNMSGSATE